MLLHKKSYQGCTFWQLNALVDHMLREALTFGQFLKYFAGNIVPSPFFVARRQLSSYYNII